MSESTGDRLAAAQAVIEAIRQAGAEVYLTPDSRIYATFIPPELHQAIAVLLPEVLILLEREGRKSLPSQGDITNRLLPDRLDPQRQALNRLAGYSQPANNAPHIHGHTAPVNIPISKDPPPMPGDTSGMVGTFIQMFGLLWVGVTCLSMFFAMAPVAVIALALGTVKGGRGNNKSP